MQPASPDWARPRNNLALLYASVAPHERRDEFEALAARASESGETLAEAQAMLFACGAGSYCVDHMLEAHRAGRARIAALELADPGALARPFDAAIAPVIELLRRCGVEDVAALL